MTKMKEEPNLLPPIKRVMHFKTFPGILILIKKRQFCDKLSLISEKLYENSLKLVAFLYQKDITGSVVKTYAAMVFNPLIIHV